MNISQLSIAIHLLIVVLVLATDDGLPPLTVVQIPLYCLLDSVLELRLWKPSKLVVDLCRVYGISHVMSLPVSHMGDKAFWLAKLFTYDLHYIYILLLIVSTYVVDLSYSSLMDDKVYRLAVILHIELVAHV